MKSIPFLLSYLGLSLCNKTFDCNRRKCMNYGVCDKSSGRCDCPVGFGGPDCLDLLCGSPYEKHRPFLREGQKACECDQGFLGTNCNVCKTDEACSISLPKGLKDAKCYKKEIIRNQKFFMCNITNPQIKSQLTNPQSTISCNNKDKTCLFEFLIDNTESFYCKFTKCTFSNIYKCEKVKCECINNRKLCGQNGDIDITDFLKHEIKGPATLACDYSKNNTTNDESSICDFHEPGLDDLVKSIFGDSNIKTKCYSGECMHSSVLPIKKKMKSKKRLFILVALLILITFIAIYLITNKENTYNFVYSIFNSGRPSYNENNDETLMINETLLNNTKINAFSFQEVSVETSDNKKIINKISGIVKKGEIMAIIGPSGAGKTTLLNTLSMRNYHNKDVKTNGHININNCKIEYNKDVIESYRNEIAYVDQKDILMSTLTIKETVVMAAKLRLPKSITIKEIEMKTDLLLKDLNLDKIKNKIIKDNISGGEKKRVCIAKELITNPSILFIDEPTSGLDTFNAKRIIEIIKNYSKKHQTIIITTIHQPNSSIFKKFDRLVVMKNNGSLFYSGLLNSNKEPNSSLGILEYLKNIDMECPSNHNPADYLLDLCMQNNIHNNETTFINEDHNETSRFLQDSLLSDNSNENRDSINKRFLESFYYKELQDEIQKSTMTNTTTHSESQEFNFSKNIGNINTIEQLKILTQRAFINIKRDYKLMLLNIAANIVIGLVSGILFYNVQNNIAGFQNRIGLFFFILTAYSLMNTSSLNTFQNEKKVFIIERNNNHYKTFPYFLAKLMADIIPNKLVPPIILSCIMYPLVGLNLNPKSNFFKFNIALCLFNISGSVQCMLIGIITNSIETATLTSALLTLVSMLFGGLILNTLTINKYIRIIKFISNYFFAIEALITNEMKNINLKEKKFGMDVDVPAAIVLSTFGFDPTAYYNDLLYQSILIVVTFTLAYFILSLKSR